MSRTILAICGLMLATGCCTTEATRHISLVSARLGTLGPSHACQGCNNCIPPRPLTCGYLDWWDYHVTQHTGQSCGFRAFAEYKRQCGRPCSHHFKSGFIAAYEDLALNRRPTPPVVPPPKYWNAYYRSCAGQPFVDDWFAGYDAGLNMGLDGGVSRFHEIHFRRGCCQMNEGQIGRNRVGTIDPYDPGQVEPQDAEPVHPLVPSPVSASRQQRTFDPYGRQ